MCLVGWLPIGYHPCIQARQQPCFKVTTIFKLIGSSFCPFWLARAWATIIAGLLQRDPTCEGNCRGPTPITGSFTVHTPSSGIIPSYEAVSYLWGNSRDYSSFQINGQVVFVPPSAERALRGLQPRRGSASCGSTPSACILIGTASNTSET